MRSLMLVLSLVILVGGAVAAATYVPGLLNPPPIAVEQPMAFNHKRHVEEDTACLDCHKEAEEGIYATTPEIKVCMLCHEEPQGEHADEPKVREYAERKEEIPWKQVNRVDGHVYFSHAVHVKLGEIDCNECHGDMENLTEVLTTSQITHMSMAACMRCHEEKQASNDCLACHK